MLKLTFLQSGRMLTNQAGRKYKFPLNVTLASKLLSKFARKAAQSLKFKFWSGYVPNERSNYGGIN